MRGRDSSAPGPASSAWKCRRSRSRCSYPESRTCPRTPSRSGSRPSTFPVGGVVEIMRMFHAASPASHQPALRPTRGSGVGAVAGTMGAAGAGISDGGAVAVAAAERRGLRRPPGAVGSVGRLAAGRSAALQSSTRIRGRGRRRRSTLALVAGGALGVALGGADAEEELAHAAGRGAKREHAGQEGAAINCVVGRTPDDWAVIVKPRMNVDTALGRQSGLLPASNILCMRSISVDWSA